MNIPNKNVMVIDMLEGFTRIGPLASPNVEKLIPAQAKFLQRLPKNSNVVFLQDCHSPDDFELRRFPPHCLEGTPESCICKELVENLTHVKKTFVKKKTFSGFYKTRIEELVPTEPYYCSNCAPSPLFNNEWIVFGCVTDCCIEANVAELVYRGNKVTVLRDLIDTWDMDAETSKQFGLTPAHVHDSKAINQLWFEHRLPAIWGVTVTTSVEFLKEKSF